MSHDWNLVVCFRFRHDPLSRVSLKFEHVCFVYEDLASGVYRLRRESPDIPHKFIDEKIDAKTYFLYGISDGHWGLL